MGSPWRRGSHEIGEAVAAKLEGRLSPTTVRQLFDLVAYVRSLKGSTK